MGLTKTTAKEYGHFGITANVVVPGLINTEIIGDDIKGIKNFFAQYAPVGRLGSPVKSLRPFYFLLLKKVVM